MDLPYTRPSLAAIRASVRASMRHGHSPDVSSDAVRIPDYSAMSRVSFRQHHVDDTREFSANARRPSTLRKLSMSSDIAQASVRQSSIRALDDVETPALSFIDAGKKASLLNSGVYDRGSESLNLDGSATYSSPTVTIVPVWLRIMWVLAIGAWSSLAYLIIGSLTFVLRCNNISRFCFSMSRWIVLPCAAATAQSPVQTEMSSNSKSISHQPSPMQTSLFLSGQWDAEFHFSVNAWSRSVWGMLAAPLCSIVHVLVMCQCWFLPVFLPMVAVNAFMSRSLWDFRVVVPESIRHRAYRLHLKFGHHRHLMHSVFGLNIVMLNLSCLAIPLIIRGYIPNPSHSWFEDQTNCTIYFVLGFVAVMPLGNFIHVSLYRLCKGTKPLYGFVANAICHALIEIAVYIYLLDKINKNARLFTSKNGFDGSGQSIVRDRLMGSMMFNLICIPGVSMVIGGCFFWQQKLNRAHVSASNLLLFVSVIIFAMPTLFDQFIVQNYYSDLTCEKCMNSSQVLDHSRQSKLGGHNYQLNCLDCFRNGAKDASVDPMFGRATRPIVIVASVFLPLLYLCGLVFSLNSHYKLIEEEEKLIQEEIQEMERLSQSKGSVSNEFLKEQLLSEADRCAEAGANSADFEEIAAHETAVDQLWTKKVCVAVFVVSLVLFALVIEKVAQSIPLALQRFNFSSAFSAVSILSWAPGIPDLVLAVLFACQNDISAAIDVGLAAALTITMIQFPILVWISSALSANAYWKPELLKEISLFNLLDLLMVFLAFFIVNMVSSQGKSTYFSGMCLIFAYVVYLLVNYYE